MDEQVKCTERDLERAREHTGHSEEECGRGDYCRKCRRAAELIASVRAEAQQAAVCKRDHWTVESSSLLAVAEKLAKATVAGSPALPEFLQWVAGRLVYVYGVSENVDFVLALHRHASELREAHNAWKEAAGK